MSVVLENWLSDKLGLPYDFKSGRDRESMGGMLLTQILHIYDVIDAEQVASIKACPDLKSKQDNFISISKWLRNVGLQLMKRDIDDLAYGKMSTLTRVLYELYLVLEGGLKSERKKINLSKISQLKMQKEVEKSKEPNVVHNMKMAALVLSEKQSLIASQRVKCDLLAQESKKAREKYIKYVLKYEVQKVEHFKSISLTTKNRLQDRKQREAEEFRQAVEEFENKIPTALSDPDVSSESKQLQSKAIDTMNACAFVNAQDVQPYFQRLKDKARKEGAFRVKQAAMHKMLLGQIWEELDQKQEEKLNALLLEKILRRSRYEKMMAHRIEATRKQKEKIIQNRLIQNEKISVQRDIDFAVALEEEKRRIEEASEDEKVEKEREKAVHLKLFEERKRIRRDRHTRLCSEAIEAIVDVALCVAEYKRVSGKEAPLRLIRDWKILFCECQPIFSSNSKDIDILDDNAIQSATTEASDEIRRQSVLDEEDLDEYILSKGPWALQEIQVQFDNDSSRITLDQLNTNNECEKVNNVLGFVVHRLLSLKYPPPPPPEKIVLPEFCVTGVVYGLSDPQTIKVLQDELSNDDVDLIVLEELINKALNQTDSEKEAYLTENANMLEALKGEASEIQNTSQTGMKISSGQVENLPSEDQNQAAIGAADKAVQTSPSLLGFPVGAEESRKIFSPSPLADLGLEISMILRTGKSLPDDLLTRLVLNYISGLQDGGGWILLDFPASGGQIESLEEKLTGMKVSLIEDDEDEGLDIIVEEVKATNIYPSDKKLCGQETKQTENTIKTLRESKLVPNPRPPANDQPFKSFMKTVIMLNNEQSTTISVNKNEILPKIPLSTSVNRFYSDLGLRRVIDTSVISSASLLGKTVAEIIHSLVKEFADAMEKEKVDESRAVIVEEQESLSTGELIVPPTNAASPPSVQLLKNNLKEGKSKASKNETSKKKPNIVPKNKSDKKSKNDKDNYSTASRPSKVIGEETGENKLGDISTEAKETPPPPPAPGEKDWAYVDLPLPEENVATLASLWEGIEKTYMADLKSLLYSKRALQSEMPPYLNAVGINFREFVQRPDNKQRFVVTFHKLYNSLADDLRRDSEIKTELHGRVADLQDTLLDVCDKRKQDAEQERRDVINENWVAELLFTMTNVFLAFLQVELDRCVLTLQLLQDYYFSMLGRYPAERRFSLVPVPLLSESRVEAPKPRSEGDVKKIRKAGSKQGLTSMDVFERVEAKIVDLYPTIAKILIETKDVKSSYSPHVSTVLEAYDTAMKKLQTLITSARDVIRQEEDTAEKNLSKMMKEQTKPTPQNKKKQVSKTQEETEMENAILQKNETVIRGASEWRAAIDIEVDRVTCRMKSIRSQAINDLTASLKDAKHIFTELYEEVELRYMREVQSVLNLSAVLKYAIEREERLMAELVLDGDEFYIRTDSMVRLAPKPPPPPPTTEVAPNQSTFTILQLIQLAECLLHAAPDGLMTPQTFHYLLSDFILPTEVEVEHRLLPQALLSLNSFQLRLFVDATAGCLEYFDWRDFVVCCLGLPWPSEQQLLDILHEMTSLDPNRSGLLEHEDYNNMTLWFESSNSTAAEHELLRIARAKQLLFYIFQDVDTDSLAYPTCLFYFCKGIQPEEGLVKALSYTMRRIVSKEPERRQSSFIFSTASSTSSSLTFDDKQSRSSSFTRNKTTLDEGNDSSLKTIASPESLPRQRSSLNEAKISISGTPRGSTLSSNQLKVTRSSLTPTYDIPFLNLLEVFTIAFPWKTKEFCHQYEQPIEETIAQIYFDSYGSLKSAIRLSTLLELPFIRDHLINSRCFHIVDISHVISTVLLSYPPPVQEATLTKASSKHST